MPGSTSSGGSYRQQSAVTAKLVAERMGWSDKDWRLAFQSRLGPSEWLTPYTDETLKELGKEGILTVSVTQPSFTADYLETIGEIGHEGLEEFREAGGRRFMQGAMRQ
ncbi:MAG: ferrochelatase [Planctomycetota bacterium]